MWRLKDFTCIQCDHSFEDLVSGNEKIPCPKCGSITKRQTGFASHFSTDTYKSNDGDAFRDRTKKWRNEQ